jgi:hypothetical protein
MDTINFEKKTVSSVRYDLEETIITIKTVFSVRHELRLTKELAMKRILQHNQVAALRSMKFTLAMGIKLSTCETAE